MLTKRDKSIEQEIKDEVLWVDFDLFYSFSWKNLKVIASNSTQIDQLQNLRANIGSLLSLCC